MLVVWGAEDRPFPLIFSRGAVHLGPFIFTKSIFWGGFISIGLLHATVFLWLIPFEIVPRYQGGRLQLVTIGIILLTIIITTAIIFYPNLIRGRKKRR